MLVDAIEFMSGVVDVEHGCAFADSENVAKLPSRLAFHRPSQAFKFSRRQAWEVHLGRRRKKHSQGRILRVHGEQLEVRNHSSHLDRTLGQWLVAIDSKKEVTSFGHV